MISLLVGSRVRLAVLVVSAVVAGIVEASLLAVIAAAAAALSQGDQVISLALGPWTLEARHATAFSVAVLLAIARAALHLVLAYLPAQMSSMVLADVRQQLFTAFTTSSWSTKANERDGVFVTLTTQNANAVAQSVVSLGAGLTATIMFMTIMAAAFLQNLIAAVTMTVLAVVLFIALRPLSRVLRRHAKRLAEATTTFIGSTQEVVTVAEETEVFGATSMFRSRFFAQVEAVRAPHVRTRFLTSAIPALQQSVALLMIVLALAAVSGAGLGQLGELASVVLMLIRALTYAQQMQLAMTNIDERLPMVDRIMAAFERYRGHPQQDGDKPLDRVDSLAFDDVTFAYPGGPEVLKGVSFSLRRGEAIGIVGPSGSGKSSTVQVLLRLREPASGAVRVNGHDVQTFSRESWRRRVAYVPQASQLISDSARENIRFFREWITDAEVEEAARRAHIHEDILSWSRGYDTLVGQRLGAVSGGQRQRICLARALAGKPDVLVLDEPTSALDVRSESLVQETLLDIKQSVALVLVAHRLSTLSITDNILVLIDGQVSAVGSRDDLLASNSFFQEVNEIAGRQDAQT